MVFSDSPPSETAEYFANSWCKKLFDLYKKYLLRVKLTIAPAKAPMATAIKGRT